MNTTSTRRLAPPDFLAGGGEMGELIRTIDWSGTPIGNFEQWPQSLRVAVGIMLNNPLGMSIAWGRDFIQLYNDSYRSVLGTSKHPHAMGSSTRFTFQEIWHILGPMLNSVIEGKAIRFPNFILEVDRNGYIEECYFDFSYSPIRIENGEVGGVLVTVLETTEKVYALKKLEESKQQLQFAIDAAELATWDYNPLTNMLTGNKRYEDWFGIPAVGQIHNDVSLAVIAEKDRARVLEALSRALDFRSGGRFDIDYTIQPPLRKRRVLRARGKAWFNEEKVAYRLNGTLQDITEEVNSRKSLIQ
ncbi:MAG: PAS domain-containing protein, partial [Flavitalea sp.]